MLSSLAEIKKPASFDTGLINFQIGVPKGIGARAIVALGALPCAFAHPRDRILRWRGTPVGRRHY